MIQHRNANSKILLVASLVTTSIFSYVKNAEAFFINPEGGNSFAVVDLTVNGSNASFAIDTELDYSLMDIESANALGLIDTGMTVDTGSSSLFNTPLFDGSILINVTEKPLEFGVIDEPSLPVGVTGRLGIDFFKETESNLDLKNLILTINPDYAITQSDNKFFVELPVKGSSGTKPLKFLIDTGAAVTTISSADSTTIGLTDTGKKITLGGAGSGTESTKSGTLDELGETNFVVTDSLKSVLPQGVTGVLGADVLGRRSIIDLKNLNLTIEKPTPPGGNKGTSIRTITTETVPEPLTILGTGVVLGALPVLKKEYAKRNQKKDKNA